MIIPCTSGFSLIEVLVSLLLISLILFGFDGAQLYSIQEAENAYLYSTAQNQLENATQRLIALQAKSSADLTMQLTNWNAENKIVLPLGFGGISGEFPNYNLSIFWGTTPHRCQKPKIGKSGCLLKNIYLV